MQTENLWDVVPGYCEVTPTIVYYPAENKTTDTTIIILPGGGYHYLADHEGQGYAEFLNSIGMDAFVCEYRVAPHCHPLPLLDARRAVQWVRFNAEKFGINPKKIGIMGSSAGGHLASSVCTITDEFPDVLKNPDDIDKEDYLPDFQVLCYPVIALNDFGHYGSGNNLLGSEDLYDPKRYALNTFSRVHEKTPKAFVWHTITDPTVPVQNSLSYISALRAKGIPAELHIFPEGGHGVGIAEKFPHIAQWTTLFKNWLSYNEYI